MVSENPVFAVEVLHGVPEVRHEIYYKRNRNKYEQAHKRIENEQEHKSEDERRALCKELSLIHI